jgi:hypothetical protein
MEQFNDRETRMDEWICGYIIGFDDDGEPEGGILARGSKETCERTAELIPAVAYNGDRPNPVARIFVRPLPSGGTSL